MIQHFEESSDYKFTGAYVVQKFEELLNVHISPRQCQTYLGRLHNLVKPGARALIKFNSKKARVRVNNFHFILSYWFSTNWSFHNALSTPWNKFFLCFIARLITLTRSSFNLHASKLPGDYFHWRQVNFCRREGDLELLYHRKSSILETWPDCSYLLPEAFLIQNYPVGWD